VSGDFHAAASPEVKRTSKLVPQRWLHVETELGSSVSVCCGLLITTDPQALREQRVPVPEWLVRLLVRLLVQE